MNVIVLHRSEVDCTALYCTVLCQSVYGILSSSKILCVLCCVVYRRTQRFPVLSSASCISLVEINPLHVASSQSP
jgi:hypothetical protein